MGGHQDIRIQQRPLIANPTTPIYPSHTKVFTPGELELLLCGVSEVNVDEWQASTLYSGGFRSTSPTIIWFWRIVRERLDNEERYVRPWLMTQRKDICHRLHKLHHELAPPISTWLHLDTFHSRSKLLQFVSGTSRVPSGGFKQLQGQVCVYTSGTQHIASR